MDKELLTRLRKDYSIKDYEKKNYVSLLRLQLNNLPDSLKEDMNMVINNMERKLYHLPVNERCLCYEQVLETYNLNCYKLTSRNASENVYVCQICDHVYIKKVN